MLPHLSIPFFGWQISDSNFTPFVEEKQTQTGEAAWTKMQVGMELGGN